MNSVTVALAGKASPSGTPHGKVATRCTGSSASASIATRTKFSSSWRSDDVVTKTIGTPMSSRRTPVVIGGSNSHGPII